MMGVFGDLVRELRMAGHSRQELINVIDGRVPRPALDIDGMVAFGESRLRGVWEPYQINKTTVVARLVVSGAGSFHARSTRRISLCLPEFHIGNWLADTDQQAMRTFRTMGWRLRVL